MNELGAFQGVTFRHSFSRMRGYETAIRTDLRKSGTDRRDRPIHPLEGNATLQEETCRTGVTTSGGRVPSSGVTCT